MIIDSFIIGLIVVSSLSSIVGALFGIVMVWYIEYQLDPKNKIK